VRAEISDVLARYEAAGIQFHAMRTRQAGAHRFVSVHVPVPGAWTVQRGHDVLENVEEEIRAVSRVSPCSLTWSRSRTPSRGRIHHWSGPRGLRVPPPHLSTTLHCMCRSRPGTPRSPSAHRG
jgi:hypothetical protein